jgi:hypothetical protein
VQVGDMGIDGRIFPVSAAPKKRGAPTGELDFMDVWYPIQVKQKDRVGRPDIDSFEAVMTREDRTKGFFVGFDYSADALREIDVLVLERGTIEAYYPATVTGRDKPTRAQQFCNTVTTRDAALGLCDDQDTDGAGRRAKEFEIIFGAILCN